MPNLHRGEIEAAQAGALPELVTLEDIMEEIVGEIRDEYDVNEELLFEQVGEGEYLFNARINFDEAAELLIHRGDFAEIRLLRKL